MAAAIPLAIEGLTAVIALASAGAVASTLARVPQTTHWDGPSIFSFGSGGGSVCLPPTPRPPKRPPHSKKKKIMAALLAGMMAKYLAKRRGTGNSNRADGGPLVGGLLGYNSTLARIDMRLKDKHEWCGHFKKGPPQNVQREVEGDEPEEDLKLVHQGTPPQGSKVGLAYAANGTQWIVAWHASLNSNPKIYVECGDEARIDWSRIEKKLDASCNESDCEGAMAQIIENGRDAVIFVVFST